MNVSIILPYYKNLEELLITLDSLNVQTLNNFEVIVVNDGSENINTILNTKNFNFELNYIGYKNNKGRAHARNIGAENAKYEYLIFLDSDQIVLSDFVEQHIEKVKNYDLNDILQFGLRNKLLKKIANIEEAISIDIKKDSRNEIFKVKSWEKLKTIWHLAFSHNISISKNNYIKLGGFDENFKGWGLEDSEFAYRAKRNGLSIIYNENIQTLSLFDNTDFDKQKNVKLLDWAKNLDFFCLKYPNSKDVYLQKILLGYFDINERKKLYSLGIKNPWVYSFLLFEEAVELLEKI